MAYTKEELIYIVGFFDGEGCVTCSYRVRQRSESASVHLAISNTNKEQLEWIQSKIGGTITTREHENLDWKTSHYLQIGGDDAATFVKDAMTISKTKKQQFIIAHLYFELRGTAKEIETFRFINDSLKKLNRRGNPIKYKDD